MMSQSKKFAWSWSKLKNWRSCPKRHYHIDLAKDVKEAPSEALMWGDEFHEAMAKRVSAGTNLPKTMARYDYWPALMHDHKLAGAKVQTEIRLAMDEEFQPTSWFDANTWVRCVVDVLYLAPWRREAAAVDWKTGKKIEPEFEQLGITSSIIMAHHDDIDTVHTAYQWAAHDTYTVNTYKRQEMTPIWASLMPEVKQMEEAARTLTYPPKPSALCIRWCPVTQCVYHGKGDRTP